MANTFECTLVTPQEEVLTEPVTYASIPAWDGQMGIAPQRAPLMVKLGDGPLRLDFAHGASRWFFLGGGFAQVKDNRLSLLTEEAVPADTVVRAEAEEALRAALDMKASSPADQPGKNRKVRRARALVNLADTVSR